MAKKSRKGNKRQAGPKAENATKSQSFEYSGSEADSSVPATQSMQNPTLESPKSSSPRKDQTNASPKGKPESPKVNISPAKGSPAARGSPKAEVLASPFLSPSGLTAAAAAAGTNLKSPQTVEFVISPMTTEAGNVQRMGSNSERVTPDNVVPPVKSPKIVSPKTASAKMVSPKVESPKSPKLESPKIKSPKVESPRVESPKVSSPKNLSPKVPSPLNQSPVDDILRESVDLAALTSPKKSPKSKQSSPAAATAGPVAVSSDGAITVTIEPEPMDSPKSRTSPKSQKSAASDSLPLFAGAAYPTSPGGVAIPIIDLADGSKSASRVASPSVGAPVGISPRVAELQAKLTSPSAVVAGSSPKFAGSGASSRKTSPVTSQMTSPKVSDLPPIKPLGTPKIDMAAVASPKVEFPSSVLGASPKVASEHSPMGAAKVATPSGVVGSPKSASRVANIGDFVAGATDSQYPSPPRAQAVDSVVVQQVTDASDSAAFQSAIADTSITSPLSPKQAVPVSVLSATAMVSSSVASPGKRSRPSTPSSFVPITFDEAMSHIAGTTGRSMRVPDNLAPLVPRKLTPMENIMAILTCKACLGSPVVRLAQELDQDKDVQTILSNTPYNSQVEIHRKIMQTIWSFFFGNSNIEGLEMVGEHWAKLGFQSIDPSVEINRSTPGGVLNLLHVLFLIENYPTDARKWLAMAGSSNDRLPFAGVSISMSSLALEKAARGTLNAQYNKDRMVTPVTGHFYVGLMRRVFENPQDESLDVIKSKLVKQVDVTDFFAVRPSARQPGMSS